MNKKTYYITTAIAYTSQKPHIGNSYEIVLTDAVARFKRMQGYDVFFMTGTDEHGQKIENKAKEAGVSPQEYVDKVAGEIRSLCGCLNTSYDKFMRTTDEGHKKVIQKIFRKLYEQGDIYKGSYKGLYCIPCESFFTPSQLIDGKCPDCGREVNETNEECYLLRLSKYQKQLEEHIEKNPDFIYPESRKKEMVNNFLKPGLQDLCVSRSSFKWGIPVDFDPEHVVYVWIDALSNYITGLGYSPDGCENGDMFNKYWPADAHMIGKDIVRQHTIYWPIMLMALGLPLPKQVYGHPWVLVGGDKMSKSTGNVIYADDLVRLFGADAIRYYLLSEIPFAQDGSLTYETIIERYNSDLANTLGNLVNRTVAMANKYFDGAIPCNTASGEFDDDLKSVALASVKEVEKYIDAFQISKAANAIMNVAKRANKYIDETMPWVLAKNESDRDRLATVLYNLIESIRFIAVQLSAFLPDNSKEILSQINCDITDYESLNAFGAIPLGSKVGEAKPLFARIETEKMLEQIKAELEEKSKAKTEIPGIAQIGIEDFAKVELKVAEILDCVPVEKAKKLLKLTLDDGSGTERTVVSGIAPWYSPENLKGRRIIVVANLKPAVLRGVESNGMILAGDCGEDDVKVVFVDEMPVGAKIR
ncbi:MAG: methionine--tRNA ligase [Oscillospiraceae bacterium]|nr:methionine--tRNA ligase [Oscillospiraceae bacterium]